MERLLRWSGKKAHLRLPTDGEGPRLSATLMEEVSHHDAAVSSPHPGAVPERAFRRIGAAIAHQHRREMREEHRRRVLGE